MWKYITEQTPMYESVPQIMVEPIISIDVETRGLNPFVDELLLVQIGTPQTVYIYDARVVNLQPLFDSLKDYAGIVCFHNGKFDCKYLRLRYGFFPNHIFDTMIAEALVHAGIGPAMVSLNNLSTRYLNRPLVKEIRDSFQVETAFFSDQQLNYAADDAISTLQLYPILSQLITDQQLDSVFDLENNLIKVVADMELRGVGFDRKTWMDCHDQSFNDFVEAEANLYKMLAPLGQISVAAKSKGQLYQKIIPVSDINLNSNAQLLEVLHRFKIKVPNTAAETLSQVDNPLVDQLLKYRKFAKRLTTYGESFFEYINPLTGKIHAEFNQIGTDTGRFSSSNPNMQNIPNPAKDKDAPNYRSAIVASDGYSFVTSDYSQIELRILAEVSQEPKFIKAYREGADLHRQTAMIMYEIAAEEVTPEQRSTAKNTNFATAYGSGPGNLSRKFHISMEMAQKLLDNFHNGYPVLSKFLQTSGQDAVINHYSKTIMGRRRHFEIPAYTNPEFKRIISAIKREGTNHIIQGSSADMTKLAMWNLWQNVGQLGGHLVITVHDEIVTEFPDATVKDGNEMVNSLMVQAGEQMIYSIPVLADSHISKYWSK